LAKEAQLGTRYTKKAFWTKASN